VLWSQLRNAESSVKLLGVYGSHNRGVEAGVWDTYKCDSS